MLASSFLSLPTPTVENIRDCKRKSWKNLDEWCLYNSEYIRTRIVFNGKQ